MTIKETLEVLPETDLKTIEHNRLCYEELITVTVGEPTTTNAWYAWLEFFLTMTSSDGKAYLEAYLSCD